MPEMMNIVEIAKRLRLNSSSVRRLIAKESDALNLTLLRGKADKLLLSKEDAERLIASYEARRGAVIVVPEDPDVVKYDRYGFFYLIQLVPEALPNRVKIGFADNVEKRLVEHRTAAPTAKVLRAWPCKRSWDYAAMDSITRTGCKLVLNEVYEGEVQSFIERGDAFFRLMPNPDSERELSEHSPLYEGADDEESETAPQLVGPERGERVSQLD
jgi:hypothetical protein